MFNPLLRVQFELRAVGRQLTHQHHARHCVRGSAAQLRRPRRRASPHSGARLAAVSPRRLLTTGQRARLGPAVAAALTAGWQPGDLASHVGANTTGIRDPAAVLAARLSQAELPPPTARRRPPCCVCDQATRMLDFDGDAPRPCPHCKQMKESLVTMLHRVISLASARSLRSGGGCHPDAGNRCRIPGIRPDVLVCLAASPSAWKLPW
jgi:hypothetical protein